MSSPEINTPLTTKLWRRWQLLLRGILHLWVKTQPLPDAGGGMGAAEGKAVCYVMDDYALSSVLILDKVCEDQGLARPLLPIAGLEDSEQRSYLVLRRLKGILIRRPSTRRSSELLRSLLTICDSDRDFDIQLVPVTVFVGRMPDKSTGLAKTLFAENWEVAGRFRRFVSTLINGRDTLVQFSRPISLSELTAEELGLERSLRKVSRILRMHFRRVRGAVIGPDLSHRRMMIDRIVRTPSVRKAIADKARRESISEEKAVRLARSYALEIAADYSYRFINVVSKAIGWFARKILRDVNMHHFDRVKEIALEHEIVYVPCHRSHMDYLLLSYLLHVNGFVAPHVAAGLNLKLPLVGAFLRRGGAFYLRRTFRSQKLYSAVFNEYVSAIIAQGVSIEYFIEGTRSRTGRLLMPKGGMLAMTVKGYLHSPVRPVVFMPVYFGYELLMEGSSYSRELAGTGKKSEKLSDLLKVFAVLKNDYGEATVSFGQPVFLDALLDKHDQNWRVTAAPGNEKVPWLNPLVDELGRQIMTGINSAADVNPINLLSSIMLATPRHSMGGKELLDQLELYLGLLANGPFGEHITVTEMNAREIVDYSASLDLIQVIPNALGEIVSLEPSRAVELKYLRNNSAHLFAVPSLLACCFLNHREVETKQLHKIARAIYPFLKIELFLPWDGDAFEGAVQKNLDLLVEMGLLNLNENGSRVSREPGDSEKAVQLSVLARCLLQTLDRYYITIAVLARNGPGTLGRGQLEKLCMLTAQRISRLFEIEAPEFYDRNLFRQFIGELRQQGILSNDPDGKILFDDRLDQISHHARFMVRKEIRMVIVHAAVQAIPEELGPVNAI